MQRRYRLTRSEDFGRMRRDGRGYPHRMMLVSIAPNLLEHNRYGFVVSKKLGTAVVRNRAKRVFREVARTLHPHLRSGYDIVIVARSGVVGQPYTVILRTVQQLFEQAGVWEM
ncbi:MAG: ribonuclease P protein component [Anaerolineae bacterium]